MSSWLRYLLAGLFVLAVGGLSILSLFGDLLATGPIASALLVVLDTRVLLGLAVAIFAVSLALYLFYLRGEDPSALVYEGKTVEALVPVYNEAAVMHRSVENLVAGSYEDLTVTIICEPDDESSTARAAELAAEHDEVRYIHNERDGSKAGALNTAIEDSDADCIAMFDADQKPHENLLAHAVAALSDNDIARVRSLPDPTGGIVEAVAYYEYLLLFFLPQKLAKFFLGMEVVGTRSVVMDRAIFEKVGLLEEDHLTEDLDFTHKCHQAGLSVAELFYYPCFEEPAHTARDWWWQRVRWMTGHVAIGHSHVRNWRSLFDTDFLGSLVTLLGTFAAGVVMATTLPKFALAAVATPVPLLAGLVGFYGIPLITRALDNRTADIEGFGSAWLLLPLAFTMFGVVIVQSILTYTLGWDLDWYQVEKFA